MGLLQNYSTNSNFSYARINQDLLVELGVEGILKKIVVPKVMKLFKPDILQFFRRCWEQGQTPTLDYLKKQKLYRINILSADTEVYDDWTRTPPVVGYKELAFVFVQIDTRHNFVERWTVFAHIWFEEIEPLFGLMM